MGNSRGPAWLQTSGGPQAGSTAHLLGAHCEVTDSILTGLGVALLLSTIDRVCLWGAERREGDEGSQAFAAEPLSKLTLWSSGAGLEWGRHALPHL